MEVPEPTIQRWLNGIVGNSPGRGKKRSIDEKEIGCLLICKLMLKQYGGRTTRCVVDAYKSWYAGIGKQKAFRVISFSLEFRAIRNNVKELVSRTA